MAQSRAPPIGEGATCSVLVNKLHPSRDVAAAIPNAAANEHVEDLVATCHAVVTRNGKTFDTIYFTSLSLPGLEMSAAERFVVVMVPGHADANWAHFGPALHAPIVPNLPPIVDAGMTIGDNIFFAQNRSEDIARVRNQGFAVDDDNDPAPKNVPAFFTPPVDNAGLFEGQSWANHGGGTGLIVVRRWGGGYDDASFRNGFTPIGKTYFQLFMYFFPMTWFSDVLLLQTSAGVVNAGATLVTFGELLRFLGLRLLMAMCSGWTVDQFWNYDTIPRDQEEDPCPYNFRTFMSKRYFLSINRYLVFKNVQKPAFVDKFWPIRRMIKSWNNHMAGIFLCTWVICLDE